MAFDLLDIQPLFHRSVNVRRRVEDLEEAHLDDGVALDVIKLAFRAALPFGEALGRREMMIENRDARSDVQSKTN